MPWTQELFRPLLLCALIFVATFRVLVLQAGGNYASSLSEQDLSISDFPVIQQLEALWFCICKYMQFLKGLPPPPNKCNSSPCVRAMSPLVHPGPNKKQHNVLWGEASGLDCGHVEAEGHKKYEFFVNLAHPCLPEKWVCLVCLKAAKFEEEMVSECWWWHSKSLVEFGLGYICVIIK